MIHGKVVDVYTAIANRLSGIRCRNKGPRRYREHTQKNMNIEFLHKILRFLCTIS